MTGEQRDWQPPPAGYQIRGVLAQIEALGLELLEVRRMPPANRL